MPLPRTLVLYNEPTLPPDHPDAESEYDILYTADCVAKAIADAGLPVSRLGVTDDPHALLAGLRTHAPDVVFNLYEGTAKWGNTEAFVAGLLELVRVPFTGSPTQPLMLARSKPLTKQLLAGAGLPTAGFFAVENLPVPKCKLNWPVIVKPGKEDASVGIEQASVVTSQKQLDERVEYVLDRYGPPVLVEEFIRGREFNVAVWDRGDGPQPLPFSEILFLDQDVPDALWPIVSFDAKWHPNSRDFKATPAKNPAEVSPELFEAVSKLATRAFELLGCRDYARVDFRVDASGKPFVLEVNPNPCISPLAGLAAALETAKVPYPEFVVSLVAAAARRGPNPALAEFERAKVGTLPPDEITPRPRVKVRAARRADAEDWLGLLAAADAVTTDERKHLARRVRRLFASRDKGGAAILTAARRGGPLGGAVVAPTNPGQGVFGLELLVVEPSARRGGVGRALLEAAEQTAATAGGRVLTIELSSGPHSAAARQFLARVGYKSAGEVAEFYKDGTARLTFAKPLPVPVPVPETVGA